MRDLTVARRQEEAKFFLAAVVETSNDSVVTIDFQRTITSWNKAAEGLYGYTAEEAIGRNLTMLTLSEDFLDILSNADAIEHSREVVVFDTVRHNKEGESIHLEIVMSPVLNASEEVIGISTIARDVSERKRREANLAFLAKINLDLAPLLTVHNVMEPVGEQLAHYLRLSSCHFSMVDEAHDRVEVIYEYRRDAGVPSVMGVHRLSDTLTQEGRRHFGAGKRAVISTAADSPLLKTPAHPLERLGFGSRVDVPHLEGGQWRFLLTISRSEVGEWRSDELELLQELAVKIYIRVERARAEEALRHSEERYRTLYNSMDEAYCIIQLLYDTNGEAYDWRFIEVNPAFEKHNGLVKVQGKTIKELAPAIESKWIETYNQVATTGESIRFEEDSPALGRVFDSYAFRVDAPQERRVAVLFSDITERKKAEEALRISEEQQVFLLKLSDALRPLSDAVAVQETVTREVMDYFGSDRCYYCEMEGDQSIIRWDAAREGLASVSGVYPMSANLILKAVIDARKPFVVRDVNTTDLVDEPLRQLCLQLQVISFAHIPVIKNGEPVGVFCVVQSTPREWAGFEIQLMEEVAERTWAAVDRAKAEEALRESEERVRLFVEASSDALYRMSPDWRRMLNLDGKGFLTNTAEPRRSWLEAYIPEADRALVEETIERVVRAKSAFELEHRILLANGTVGWTLSRAIPMLNEEGEILEWFGAASDITRRKEAEGQLQELNQNLEQQVDRRTAELRQAQQLLQTIFDHIPIGISVLEPVYGPDGTLSDFMIAATNRELAREAGRADLVGKHYAAEYPGIRPAGLFDRMLAALATGDPQQLEYCYPYEGNEKWYAASLVRSEVGLVATQMDITSRKQADKTIREQAHFITSITETVPDMISVMNYPSRQIAYANHEAFVHQGFDAEALKETNPEALVELVHPDDREALTRYFNAFSTLSNEEVATLTYRARTGSLSWQWFHVRGKVFARNPAGQPDQILNVIQNINRQKGAESEVMKNLTLLQQTEAVAQIGSWEYDRSTKEFYWSDGMYRLFGLKPGTPISPQAYLDYAVEEDRPVAERVVRLLQEGTEPVEESMRIQVDGQVLTLKIKASVLHDEAGRPRKMVGVDLEYSELKRLEAENLEMRLKQQKRLLNAILEAQEEEKNRIAESLHNGLAQQLYAVRLRLESIPVASGEEEIKAKALFLLSQAIEQTRDLSHELTPRMLEQFGLAEAVKDFCDKLSSEQLLIRCKVKLAGPLEKHLEVALYRISQEVVTNIVKHAQASAASLKITQQAQEVMLEAKDNGQGFDANRTRKKGLGLASIRSRVDLLGGRLEVDTSPGKGALIRIHLPLA